MLVQADFEQKIVANLKDVDVVERYYAQDPIVLQQIRSIAAYFALLSQEIDVATIEPFIKSRDRSIIADATNKNILPLATPCQHQLEVINNGYNSVTLSQGRTIEDNGGGRVWRLLQSVTVAGGEIKTVPVEQSQYRELSYDAPTTEAFHRYLLELSDDMYLCDLRVYEGSTQLVAVPRWQNVARGDYAYNLTTDSLRRIFVEFGDSERAGRTVQSGERYMFGIYETTGEVDVSRLKDAALTEVLSNDEQRIVVRFQAGGLIAMGADPLNVSQLRVLASYPALYDENAVYLGNFDFLVRKKFMARANFISVWNENIHERYYGADYRNINHLHVAISAKNPGEQNALQNEVALIVGRADSLYMDRVIFDAVVKKPFNVTIQGRLAAVHDMDAVIAQIRRLLVERYGEGTLSASRWLVNGFNTQEIATLIRSKITAFQDRISDFSVYVPHQSYKPHEWVYMTEQSIAVTLERTADSVGASWIL